MTSPVDRITAVLRASEPILRQKSQTCLDCRHGKPGDHAAHVAERVVESLAAAGLVVVPDVEGLGAFVEWEQLRARDNAAVAAELVRIAAEVVRIAEEKP